VGRPFVYVAPVKLTSALTAGDRRLVVALCVAAAFALTLSTAFNYLLAPIQEEFDPSDGQFSTLRQAPSLAALLVVFPAGVLGARVGEKRFVLWCSLVFAAGSALVAVAPIIELVTLGFLLANIGRAAMFIVGLGYMASAVEGKDARAAAFAFFSMVLPIVYIVMPVVAGLLIDGAGWRWVAVICAIFGVIGAAMVKRLVPEREARGSVGEMWTPAVAGVFLAFMVQALDSISTTELLSPTTVRMLLAGAVALGILVVMMRRMKNPTLSLAPLRRGGFALLLLVIMLFGFANLWFYTTMAFQYVFGLNSLQTALAMIPCQVASLGGAALAGRLIQVKGIAFAGFVLIIGVAIFLWCSMLVAADSPLWVPIVIVSLYALAAVGAGVPLTNAIMNDAPKGSEGAAASYRGAATNLGSALSVALMTSVVMFAVSYTFQAEAEPAGVTITRDEAIEVGEAVDAGQSASSVAQQYQVPIETVEAIQQIQTEALISGYRAHGLVGGCVTFAVAVAFFVLVRRQERGRDRDSAPTTDEAEPQADGLHGKGGPSNATET